MAVKKNIDINELKEVRDLLKEIQGNSLYVSLSSDKANEELKEFLKTNEDCKIALEKLAEAQDKYNNARNKGQKVAAEESIKSINKKYKEELEKIKDVIEEINKKYKERLDIDSKIEEMERGINVELEKERRSVEKQYELFQLQKKSIREGLTWDEKRYQLLTKFGEQIGINTDKFKTGFNDIKKNLSEAKGGIEGLNKAWGTVDQAAADYIRHIGGTAASMKRLRDTTIDFMNTRSIGVKYNTSMEELIKLQGDYNASIGRSIDLTNDQKETFAAMRTVVGDQAAMDFSLKLENFGLNPDEVGSRVGQMFSEAAKSGVAFEKYSKNFLDNIKLAQNYNFQNGLKGLAAMAKKATEIKLDMQQIARFADKVSTLEGAVTAGASLSVLGGSFARMGNPLSMLYEGLNDMESLQDRMIKMFGKLGKWDFEKGQVDVSVFNKQRIRAAAEATGMDYSALMESINASARRNIIEGRLGSKYSNDKEFRDLLLNKAQLDEKGNAFVTINGERRDVNKLTAADEAYLKTTNNSDSDNIAEIAVNTRGFKTLTEGFDKQKDAASAQVNKITHLGETTKSILSSVGENSVLMSILGAGTDVLKIMNGTLGTFYASYIMFNSLGGGAGSTSSTIGKGGNLAGYNTARSFAKGGYGKAVTFGGNKTALGKRAVKNIAKAGGYGKYVARGVGLGAGLGIAGALGDRAINNTELGQNKGEHIGWYTASKTTTGALTGAGIGASIGSIIPGIGTLIGAGVGAAIGAGLGGSFGYVEAKKENIANYLRSNLGATINNPNAYDINELERMKSGSKALSPTTIQKMVANGDNLGGYMSGGYTGKHGDPYDPTNIVGAVHPEELVINKKGTDAMLSGAIAKVDGNTLNVMKVSENHPNENKQLINNNPIDCNVNFGGSITINVPNYPNMDTKQMEQIINKALEEQFKNPRFTDQIISASKSRDISSSGRIDRNKTSDKYAIPMNI